MASSAALPSQNEGGAGMAVIFFAGEETDLLQRFRDGERSALETVYVAYVDAVARVVASALRRYCGGADRPHGWRDVAAELPDLVQEVFTRAFERGARLRFDGVREYAPYLTAIAHNIVVDYLRRRQRLVIDDLTPFVGEIAIQGQSPDHADDFAHSQIVALVAEYVAGLPSELRQVHEALYVQGLSQRQAAEALGLGRQVVRTLESRLKEGLANVLRGVDVPDVRTTMVVQAPALLAAKEKVP
jgi:RNA polymerase sigma factor (sigma-70 family)